MTVLRTYWFDKLTASQVFLSTGDMAKATIMYQPSPELTPKQIDFLGRAWAFLQTRPEKGDLDKLLVFASLLLPEEDAECLRRAVENGQVYPPGDPNNNKVN